MNTSAACLIGLRTSRLKRTIRGGLVLLALAVWATAAAGCGGGKKALVKPSGGTTGPDVFWVDVTGSDFNPSGTAVAPWLTIDRALMVAGPGDVIMVGAGTFQERNIVPPFVEIRGSGVGVTIIDGAGDGPVFTFQPGAQAGNSALRDLTIINGKGDDTRGIIYIKKGSPTINNIKISGSDVYGSSTGAMVQIEGWGSPLISNLTIVPNLAVAGELVAVRGNGITSPTITNLAFSGASNHGGLVLTEGAQFTISNSTLDTSTFPAAMLSDVSHLTASNCTFKCYGASGVLVQNAGGADLTLCMLQSPGNHGLELTDGAVVSLNRCEIQNCNVDGIHISGSAGVSAVNTIIHHTHNSGVFLADGTGGPGSSFIHCTISDHDTNGLQTGTTGTGKLYVFNSLITYNGTLATDQVAGTQWVIEHSGLTDATGTGGTNVTMANPQYTNKFSGDYTIPTTSPAVDIGDPNLGSPPGSAVPAVDFAGAARSGASNPDAGAHEGI